MAKQLTAWRNGNETPVHPLQHALKDMGREVEQPVHPSA
jgi:hypothetical protein